MKNFDLEKYSKSLMDLVDFLKRVLFSPFGSKLPQKGLCHFSGCFILPQKGLSRFNDCSELPQTGLCRFCTCFDLPQTRLCQFVRASIYPKRDLVGFVRASNLKVIFHEVLRI